jgi:AcrR family transcriptional regulator
MALPARKHAIRTNARGDRARERIVEVAETEFAERGFYGTSVRELATALGMPTASILHHYPTKEKIYDAVLANIASELGSVIGDALEGKANTRAKLRRLVIAFIEWTERFPARSRLLLRELMDNRGRVAAAKRMHLAPVVDRIAGLLDEGIATGEMRKVDPFLATIWLAGAIAYFEAAHPTLERIAPHGNRVRAAWRREAVSLMERAVIK